MSILDRRAAALWAGALLLGFGCREAPPEDPVIVQIGDRSVTRSEFERYLAATGAGVDQGAAGELESALLEQFIEEQLLLRAADEEGIGVGAGEPQEQEKLGAQAAGKEATSGADGDESEPSSLPRRRSDPASVLRIRKLIETKVLSGIQVSDEEVAAYYQNRRSHFRRPEAVDVSQILLETREQAERVRQELGRQPGRFEELARERSVGPEAATGGRLGAFRRGELPSVFEQEVFGLPPGRLSPVVQTDFGYHVFRVNRVIAAHELSLKEASDAIRVELMRRKSDEALTGYLEALKKRNPVTVFAERLGFPYIDRKARGEDRVATQGKEDAQ